MLLFKNDIIRFLCRRVAVDLILVSNVNSTIQDHECSEKKKVVPHHNVLRRHYKHEPYYVWYCTRANSTKRPLFVIPVTKIADWRSLHDALPIHRNLKVFTLVAIPSCRRSRQWGPFGHYGRGAYYYIFTIRYSLAIKSETSSAGCRRDKWAWNVREKSF